MPSASDASIPYASPGPMFWPFLRRSARAPTNKAVRGTIAIKATNKRAVRSPYGAVCSPYRAVGSSYRVIGSRYGASVSLMGLFYLFNCRSRASGLELSGFRDIRPQLASSIPNLRQMIMRLNNKIPFRATCGFTETIPWTENPKRKKEESVLVNRFRSF